MFMFIKSSAMTAYGMVVIFNLTVISQNSAIIKDTLTLFWDAFLSEVCPHT